MTLYIALILVVLIAIPICIASYVSVRRYRIEDLPPLEGDR